MTSQKFAGSSASSSPASRLADAIVLAGKAHSGDRWGPYPYLVHLALAAAYTRQVDDDPLAECAAWLHDVLEDHPEYRGEVEQCFPELVSTLQTDARRADETYDEFIDRILASGDWRAIAVKYGDMTSNLVNDPPERLRTRYERNLPRLREALASR